jgi:ParB family chromosome partitioning protein
LGKRLRNEIGDIENLVNSIKEVDLLHPIVIDENNKLVAGYRRLQACKELGWNKIPCHVISIDDSLIGEFHENAVRKNFTVLEIVAITDYIESTRIGHRPKKGDESSPLPKGKTSEVVAKLTGKSKQTIDKIKEINRIVLKNPQKYKRIVERLDKEKMSVNTAHSLLTQKQRSLPKIDLPFGVSDVILCDFPTRFNRGATAHASADKHYDTMSLEEILQWLDDQDATKKIAKDAVGFFWFSTAIQYTLVHTHVNVKGGVARDGPLPLDITIQMPFYHAVLTKLGFNSVQGEIVWKKDKIGLGRLVRNQHEKCLIAFKGNMPMPAEIFSSVIEAPRGEHSRKPELYYIIEKMFPKRKYQEWFSRYSGTRKNWKFHGNEIKEILN